MNKVLRWSLFIIGLVIFLLIYGVWKEIDKHSGGGVISAFIRGGILFVCLAFLFNWAKGGNPKISTEKSTNAPVPSTQHPTQNTPFTIQSNIASKTTVSATNTHVQMTHIEASNKQELYLENLEDWAYEKVGEELESNNPDKAAWTKAFAQSGGDDKQTRVLYIQLRVEKLVALETARLANAIIEQEQAELERLDGERKAREHQEMLFRKSKLERVLFGKTLDDVDRLAASEEGKEFLSWCSWGFEIKVCEAVKNNPLLLAISSSNGNTGLHWAVVTNHVSIVAFLLEQGAMPLASNDDGQTPVSIAKAKGNKIILEILEQYPA